MNTYEVTNHEELENAIWSSVAGNTININDGKYGYIPLKGGVHYNFAESASVVDILVLGISFGDWSAERIEVGALKTENNSSNKLKEDWGAEKLNQFQIFYRQKPWEWYRYLQEFLQKPSTSLPSTP